MVISQKGVARKFAEKKGNPELGGENRASITEQLRGRQITAVYAIVRRRRWHSGREIRGGVQCGRLMRRGVYPDDKFELNCTHGEVEPIERVGNA